MPELEQPSRLVPSEGVCLLCGTSFLYKRRSQGGGTRRKWCSHRCGSLNWARGNPEKRQAIVTKYDQQPINKEKKRERMRVYSLQKKYHLTDEGFQEQLRRQNFRCYGCRAEIDRYSARVDHCHQTEKVRGLLCDGCNFALGHAKNNPQTLRRLMAYLDYDRSKLNIYLIGTLKNKRIPDIGNLLRCKGYDVMDEWFTPGELADLNWQAYEKKRGRSYVDALRGRAATNIFSFDRSYLDHSDIAILVAPAGKSAMLELGYAKGSGKRAWIFLDGKEPDRYDVMPGLADAIFKTEEELLTGLANFSGGVHEAG